MVSRRINKSFDLHTAVTIDQPDRSSCRASYSFRYASLHHAPPSSIWIIIRTAATDPKSDAAKAEMTRSVNLAISSRGLGAIQAIEPSLGRSFLLIGLRIPDSCPNFVFNRDHCSQTEHLGDRPTPLCGRLVGDFLDLSLPMKGRMIWDFENKFVPRPDVKTWFPVHGL